jgi:hypothetical protein
MLAEKGGGILNFFPQGDRDIDISQIYRTAILYL